MQARTTRGVPHLEHGVDFATALPKWDDLRAFLQVARDRSFRASAERRGASMNTLRRRVEALEQGMGAVLLTRHVDGIKLTAEGERVLAIAEQMEAASLRLATTQPQSDADLEGVVRVGVTEGLGTLWLAPRMVEFQRAYPKMLIDMTCEMRSADVLRLEVDLSVQLTEPTSPDLKRIRLGRLHVMPFASAEYLATFGAPANLDDVLTRHRLVLQVGEQTRSEAMFRGFLPGKNQAGHVAFRSNVASACLSAIMNGAGIGFAPTYVHVLGASIVPVDIRELRIFFDVWLTYHPDLAHIVRVRRTIEWLVDAFDSRRYPWFRSDFVHPDQLPALYQGAVYTRTLFSHIDRPSNVPG